MSGKGPQNTHASQSKYTKPLIEAFEARRAEERNSDHGFKKTTQVVGTPPVLDHNVMDDYIKKPPHNHPDDVDRDHIVEGAGDVSTEPNTVEAKPVEEIQARLDRIERSRSQELAASKDE